MLACIKMMQAVPNLITLTANLGHDGSGQKYLKKGGGGGQGENGDVHSFPT